jgi:hypothetical protein
MLAVEYTDSGSKWYGFVMGAVKQQSAAFTMNKLVKICHMACGLGQQV